MGEGRNEVLKGRELPFESVHLKEGGEWFTTGITTKQHNTAGRQQ
jgi:hypothetical protein